METNVKLLLAIFLLISPPASACDINGQTGIMPPNDMKISIDSKFRNDLTEQDFNQILEKAEKVYRPIVQAKKKRLKIISEWNDDTVNATAKQVRNTYKVIIFGGIGRHPETTKDSLLLVVCHELGHHLGGAPRKGKSPKYWASSEGQADYWGALKCMKRILKNENNSEVVESLNVPAIVKDKCEEAYIDNNEIALCIRTSIASYHLSKLLAKNNEKIDFETPDQNVVVRTYTSHPETQCRLDTYFQGSLCDRDYRDDVDFNDSRIGVCSRGEEYETGVRPLCWYKP